MSAPSGVLAGEGLTSGLAMAAMALVSVSLWTLRVAFSARGRKILGAAVSAVEAVVFAVAFSSLAASLDAPIPVIGYGLGVAAGTLLGLCLEERASRGKSGIQVVTNDDGEVLERLRGLGWPATWFLAEGTRGSVTVAWVAVDDDQVRHVVSALERALPDAFLTVQRLRKVHPSQFGRRPPRVTSLDRRHRRRAARHARIRPTRTRENTHDQNTDAAAA